MTGIVAVLTVGFLSFLIPVSGSDYSDSDVGKVRITVLIPEPAPVQESEPAPRVETIPEPPAPPVLVEEPPAATPVEPPPVVEEPAVPIEPPPAVEEPIVPVEPIEQKEIHEDLEE
jgi:Predicted membrane protein